MNIRTIYLYEYALAGGAWGELHDAELVRELTSEGTAMAVALEEDLRAAGYDVQLASRATSHSPEVFAQACRTADAVWIVAPELQHILATLTALAESSGARLLSPAASFIRLTQDKHATAEWLRAHGVRAPRGFALPGKGEPTPVLPWDGPAVLKPRDGAGSTGVQLWPAPHLPPTNPAGWRVEQWVRGLSVSVAALCRDSHHLALMPCEQRLGGESGFQYLGGSLPLPEPLAQRATTLALSALKALPPTCGYVGLDLVLGLEPDGLGDTVIEVNPRLTTSYVGLRRAAGVNLAAACIDHLLGGLPLLTWHGARLEFGADGRVPSAAPS